VCPDNAAIDGSHAEGGGRTADCDVADRHRVLFLTPQYPYPPEQGAALRNYGLVRGIAERHALTLLTFASNPLPGDDPLATACRRVVSVPVPERSQGDRLRTLLTTGDPDMAHRLRSPAFSEALGALLSEERYDIVQVEGIELAPYALEVAEWLGEERPRIVFDDHNVEYLLQRRAVTTDLGRPERWPFALYSVAQWRRLLRLEQRVCRLADAVLVVSEEDGIALRRPMPSLNPVVIPNGLDTDAYRLPAAATMEMAHPAVLFTGKMDYRPNVDAMLWFHAEVWPQVRAAEPGAHLYVVGQSPHARLRPLQDDTSITVTGYVPDTMPYFGAADLYVAPFRMGGGTRLKILQALAAGLPLVTTPLGAEGIALVDGIHACVADGAEEVAGALVHLWRDRAGAARLAAAGREFVANRYDWRAIIPQLEAVYAGLCRRLPGR
jgi:glycosyltransferase involved in cell wall biosynthesis